MEMSITLFGPRLGMMRSIIGIAGIRAIDRSYEERDVT